MAANNTSTSAEHVRDLRTMLRVGHADCLNHARASALFAENMRVRRDRYRLWTLLCALLPATAAVFWLLSLVTAWALCVTMLPFGLAFSLWLFAEATAEKAERYAAYYTGLAHHARELRLLVLPGLEVPSALRSWCEARAGADTWFDARVRDRARVFAPVTRLEDASPEELEPGEEDFGEGDDEDRD